MPKDCTDGNAPPSIPIIFESELIMFEGSTLGALELISHRFLPYNDSVVLLERMARIHFSGKLYPSFTSLRYT
jgi:hypothetical protein